jgi:hypothetical protein
MRFNPRQAEHLFRVAGARHTAVHQRRVGLITQLIMLSWRNFCSSRSSSSGERLFSYGCELSKLFYEYTFRIYIVFAKPVHPCVSARRAKSEHSLFVPLGRARKNRQICWLSKHYTRGRFIHRLQIAVSYEI